MRVVSLLPAATEIVGALGLIDRVVGVSHECDFPPAAASKPKVTACEIHGKDISSSAIDTWVSERIGQGQDLFTLDEPLLRRLQPELILTQKLCDVCAPAYGSVTALAQTLPGPPRVLNLEPSCLEDIFDNIRMVAQAMSCPQTGDQLIQKLEDRVAQVERLVEKAASRPRVAVVEWLDPVFCSGHWTPELVERAGGIEVLGQKGQDSVRRTWADVQQAQPEILVIACCGQTASRALADWETIITRREIQDLAPVQTGQVFAVDGNAYFSRPGPRIVDTLEILSEIIHPNIFKGMFPDRLIHRIGDR